MTAAPVPYFSTYQTTPVFDQAHSNIPKGRALHGEIAVMVRNAKRYNVTQDELAALMPEPDHSVSEKAHVSHLAVARYAERFTLCCDPVYRLSSFTIFKDWGTKLQMSFFILFCSNR